MNIFLLGSNHKIAGVEFREKIAVSGKSLPGALKNLAEISGLDEGVIVSTCNRTELYATAVDGVDVFSLLKQFVCEQAGLEAGSCDSNFYRLIGEDAVRHLFRVTSGLDSMILGEPQIAGQVKDAFRAAKDVGTIGVLLTRLLNHSFTAGKRVRSETALCAGAVSVAYAAVELAQKIFKDLSRRSVLLIGAGETGELTAKHLHEKGIGQLFIANRTASKAEALAAELQGNAVPFDQMNEIIPKVDIIIGAATAPRYLIRSQDLEPILQRRRSNPLFLIDIGVPRNFDPAINRLESVFLHDIDSMEQIVSRNLEKRKQEVPRAEAIISQEVNNFLEWRRGLEVTPTIVALRQKLDTLRQLEIKKHQGRLSSEQLKEVEQISRAIVNKILHQPMVQLKKFGNGKSQGLLRLDVVRELFGLEDKD